MVRKDRNKEKMCTEREATNSSLLDGMIRGRHFFRMKSKF